MSSTFPTRPTDSTTPHTVHLGNAPEAPPVAPTNPAPPIASEQEIAAAKALAEKMFGAAAEIEEDYDPGDPETRWLSVNVRSGGASQQLINIGLEWHEQLHQTVGAISLNFKLCVLPLA